jgi:hypothetical protein
LLISKFLFFYTLTLLGFWIFYFIKYKPKIIYNANNIKKDIINAKSAVASVNAKPNKQYLNNSSAKSGFLETAIKKEPKTIPIPAPAPARPVVHKPAPIILGKTRLKYSVQNVMTNLSISHKCFIT